MGTTIQREKTTPRERKKMRNLGRNRSGPAKEGPGGGRSGRRGVWERGVRRRGVLNRFAASGEDADGIPVPPRPEEFAMTELASWWNDPAEGSG